MLISRHNPVWLRCTMLQGATHPRGAGMRRLECLDLTMVLTTEAMHSTPLLNLLTGMPRAMGLALALKEVVSKVEAVLAEVALKPQALTLHLALHSKLTLTLHPALHSKLEGVRPLAMQTQLLQVQVVAPDGAFSARPTPTTPLSAGI